MLCDGAYVWVICPEKKKLCNRDYPLWERILQGPSDDIMKIFLMDMHEEEVSNDVSAKFSFLIIFLLTHLRDRFRVNAFVDILFEQMLARH